jgi:hypothetical protein
MTVPHRTPVETRTATPHEAGWRCAVNHPQTPTRHRPSLSWRLRH